MHDPITSHPDMSTLPNETSELILHRPKVFVAAALQFEWFSAQTGILRELIRLISAYACTPCMSQSCLRCIHLRDCSLRLCFVRTVLAVTTFGCGDAGYSDGPHSEAKFDGPSGLCLSLDGKSFVIVYRSVQPPNSTHRFE